MTKTLSDGCRVVHGSRLSEPINRDCAGQDSNSNDYSSFHFYVICRVQRRTEPQPRETEPRRSLGAANLPAPPQTEGEAAVGSSEKLGPQVIILKEHQRVQSWPRNAATK